MNAAGLNFPPAKSIRTIRRFGIIILAAGGSTRMGSPKQLIEIAGKPLLVGAVEAALGSRGWPVIVVLGANAEQILPVLARLPVITVENSAWAEGMASSIRAGVTALHQFSREIDAALIALCDQPAFSGEIVARLVAAQHESGRSIAAAQYAGRRAAPALFGAGHFPALMALTGEEGARALIDRNAAEVAAVDLPELAFDVDVPGDLTKMPSAVVEAFARRTG